MKVGKVCQVKLGYRLRLVKVFFFLQNAYYNLLSP